MHLTQIEKLAQRRLRKAKADLYSVDVVNENTGDTISLELYADSEHEAILLGRRISKRTERSLLKDMNMDLSEMKDNKLGLVLPWKNPVNQRSVEKSITMPLKRSKSIVKDILAASRGTNCIDVTQLDTQELEKMKTSCLKNNFVSLIFLFIACYVFYITYNSNPLNLTVILCLVMAITSRIKTSKAEQIIKQEEIQRKYLEGNSNAQ